MEGRRWVKQPGPAKATILQSAVLKTTAVHRPSPTLFYFPGLTSRPVWSHHSSSSPSSSPPVSSLKAQTTAQTPSRTTNVGSEQIDNSVLTDEASSSTKLEPFPWLRELQKPENVQNMKKEYLSLIEAGVGSDYSTKDATRPSGEHKMHNGDWSWHTMISKGELQPSFQESCPETTRLLTEVVGSELMSGSYLPFSFAFFSTLHARSSIAPHCAPCNLRLRVHLPLVTPSATAAERAIAAAAASENSAELDEGGEQQQQEEEEQQEEEHECGMRVGNSVVPWKYGEALIFDDAFEHEVWNHTDSDRVVLLFDVWHPDISFAERLAVLEMFEGMKKSSTSSPQL